MDILFVPSPRQERTSTIKTRSQTAKEESRNKTPPPTTEGVEPASVVSTPVKKTSGSPASVSPPGAPRKQKIRRFPQSERGDRTVRKRLDFDSHPFLQEDKTKGK